MKESQVNGEQNGHSEEAAKGSKKALEQIYTKKTQLEHILLRPDTYIGSVEFNTERMWVYDKECESIVQREVTYVPGLYKIFDEILVNAADHKQRDPKMDAIKIDINQEENTISIWNNGKGIPVSIHRDENLYVPTMIFGHLLTSSNFDDEEQKVTGGRNGYGAKLCNIFSSKFVVETACQQYKKSFKQAWANNMTKASEPKIKNFSSGGGGGPEFTKITFSPDLAKFKMTSLDDDIVAIMSRRAFDVAASTRGVKVFLNGSRVFVKNFKDYVDLFIKDKQDNVGNPIKCVYECASDRWEVAVAISDAGFQQMSFVNSIATTKGGRHVDYITDMVVKNIMECLKKKNKTGLNVKPFQIKSHLWVFINALIVNPTFDSQTKENMTLQAKSFGSKCQLSDKFITAVVKCGIVEAVMSWAKFKQEQQLQSKCAAKKQNKIKGIPKLEDANDAGGRYSSSCTLILTEGDSAKTLAVAGLGVVGRDRYGVFPLKGKMLNVREATHHQIYENAEINNIIKIIGLQYKKSYSSDEDYKTLRYGKLMIMTDQDQDGSHIKGLLINFIHHKWPQLLKRNFLEEFITPIVKAVKGKEEFSFYSLPEFEEWKKAKQNWHTYKIKYYKGLGTSTSKEAKEYFQDMNRHRIVFSHSGPQDDHAITMAFSKKAIEQRKEWLTTWMEECKRRKELGLREIYLYEKDTKAINYADFVNKELVLFSNLDNERSIPSLVDGLKPGQRKVLFTCFKRNDKREVKVAQLAGSVGEHSAYHHGEASLMSTIINLAQNFVGSNNINLLKPIGQFGTRLLGGKDAASPRYIFTQLSSLARLLFDSKDEPLLNFLKDDNKKIEPEWYLPIIPMVLVNGAEGIGTGWSTKIPNYNPRDIVDNLKRMMRGEEPRVMNPWFKNFLGVIEELDNQRFIVSGEVSKLSYNKFEITELPIRTWTQVYKEGVMETLLSGTEKSPALVSDYREYHTDKTVKFVVTVPEDKVERVEQEGPHKVFKLQTTFTTSSMVLFDSHGCLKRYDTPAEILREFFDLRLAFYEKRKNYMVGMLEAEAAKLSNQARFIIEKCDGRLTVENKKRKDMIAELHRKGYDSDPVKTWKLANQKEPDDGAEEEGEEENSGSDETTAAAAGDDHHSSSYDYDYLLSMTMWTLTKEKKDELLKKKQEKVHELEVLKKMSPKELWEVDLDKFLEQLEVVETKERAEDLEEGRKTKGGGAAAGGGSGGVKKRTNKLMTEALPSPSAQRIVPRIDEETKRKAEKAAAAKEKTKNPKKAMMGAGRSATASAVVDEFDALVNEHTKKNLVARLGTSPDAIDKEMKAKNKKPKLKQTTLNFKPTTKTTKTKKAPVVVSLDDDDDENENGPRSDDDDDFFHDDVQVAPRERTTARRNAAAKVKKYSLSDSDDSDDDDDDDDLSFHSNDGIDQDDDLENASLNFTFDDSVGASEMDTRENENEKNEKNRRRPMIEVSDSDSDFEVATATATATKGKAKPPARKENEQSASDMFDDLLGNSPQSSKRNGDELPLAERLKATTTAKPKAAAAATQPKKKKAVAAPPAKSTKTTKRKMAVSSGTDDDDDDDDDFFGKRKRKKGGATKKAPTKQRKKAAVSDDDDDEDFQLGGRDDDEPLAAAPTRQTSGRSTKAAKYRISSSSDDDHF